MTAYTSPQGTAQFLQSLPYLAEALTNHSNKGMQVSLDVLNFAFARRLFTVNLLHSRRSSPRKTICHFFDPRRIVLVLEQARTQVAEKRPFGPSVCASCRAGPLLPERKGSRLARLKRFRLCSINSLGYFNAQLLLPMTMRLKPASGLSLSLHLLFLPKAYSSFRHLAGRSIADSKSCRFVACISLSPESRSRWLSLPASNSQRVM